MRSTLTQLAKRWRAWCACCLLAMAATTFGASPSSADLDSGPSRDAENCRAADESGALDAVGATRGACITSSSGGHAAPSANRIEAGLCQIEFFQVILGVKSAGECQQRLESANRPFSATLVQDIDQFGPVTGSGSVIRMGAVTESGELLGIDLSDYPPTADVYFDTTLTSGGDQLSIHYGPMVLTDVGTTGEEFTIGGNFAIVGGTGRFEGAYGNGALTGSCTSPIGDPVIHCSTDLTGLIGY